MSIMLIVTDANDHTVQFEEAASVVRGEVIGKVN